MENKQTAVGWLFEKLWDTPKDKFNWFALLQEAKEMEKEQIKNAYFADLDEEYFEMHDADFDAEKYYKKTYGTS